MRDFVILFLHLIATVARLAGPGGIRSLVAESVLVKHQLLILNRSRKRVPHLLAFDRIGAGLCALLMRPARIIRSGIVWKPSTLWLANCYFANNSIAFSVLCQPFSGSGSLRQ